MLVVFIFHAGIAIGFKVHTQYYNIHCIWVKYFYFRTLATNSKEIHHNSDSITVTHNYNNNSLLH